MEGVTREGNSLEEPILYTREEKAGWLLPWSKNQESGKTDEREEKGCFYLPGSKRTRDNQYYLALHYGPKTFPVSAMS